MDELEDEGNKRVVVKNKINGTGIPGYRITTQPSKMQYYLATTIVFFGLKQNRYQ